MHEAIAEVLGRFFGSAVTNAQMLGGGDINDAWLLTFADGQKRFIKTNDKAPQGLFATEKLGLLWLAEAKALTIPEVLVEASELKGEPWNYRGPEFLALEYLAPKAKTKGFDALLGEGLAKLHRCGAPDFGWPQENFLGTLPQSNRPHTTWAGFYGEERLWPLLRRAEKRGLADAALMQKAEALMARLPNLVGPPEPPARLHGDLWAGNLHMGHGGEPALIDPAVYGGHREMDLAMMRLFGGFSNAVFDAYQHHFPLAPGHQSRIPLCQLYPLLAHLNLFGRGYYAQVLDAIERYV